MVLHKILFYINEIFEYIFLNLVLLNFIRIVIIKMYTKYELIIILYIYNYNYNHNYNSFKKYFMNNLQKGWFIFT